MRKTKIVTITAEGRDKGKSFMLTEFPAMRVEKWAARVLLALGRSGVEVPDEATDAGAVAVLSAGLTAFRQMGFEDAEPLLDEMMECVSFVPDVAGAKDPVTDQPLSRQLIPDDIEEVATLLLLRSQIFELHVGFSLGAALSTFGAAIADSTRPVTRTSPKPSARSSGGASRRSTTAKRSTG